MNADGNFIYTPDKSNPLVKALRTANDALTETFSYTMRDYIGATSSASLTITIQGANDAPTAVADTGTAMEAGSAAGSNAIGNVLTNDFDVDTSDPITVSTILGGSIGSPVTHAYGSLTLNADGSYSYSVNNSNLYVNALRQATDTITDSFSYTVRDSMGELSTTSLVIVIKGQNDAPMALGDTGVAFKAGASASGNVLSNDTDADAQDSKTVALSGTGMPGTVVQGNYGSVIINADGSYVYTVRSTSASIIALGSDETLTDNFSYTVSDAAGATSSASLKIKIFGSDATIGMAANPAIDNVTNLDVGSAIVLTFAENIQLGSGQIRIMDDMGTNGWIAANPTTGESKQDTYDNDVVLTLDDGVVTGFSVGGIDKSAYIAGSVTVSGKNLIINPSGDHGAAGNNTWNFDWDFGSNYHIELDTGAVVGITSGAPSAAVGAQASLNFTTVAPVANATGAASQKMNTETGALEGSYIWHSAHVSSDAQTALPMNFSGGAHALVIQSSGGTTRQTSIGGKVELSRFGVENGAIVADDLLYNDNLGNQNMNTTDGTSAAFWDRGNERSLSNTTSGGFSQRVIFNTFDFPSTWKNNIIFDAALENASHYNANVIVFG